MYSPPNRFMLLFLAAVLLSPTAVLAIVPQEEADAPQLKTVSAPQLAVAPSPLTLGPVEKAQRMSAFTAKYSDAWQATWDLRSDRPLLIQGAGVPLLGSGLTKKAMPRDVESVAEILQGFLAEQSGLLKTAGLELRFDAGSSSGHQGYFWSVEFQQYFEGIPVDGAKTYFRVNHGNVVQFGTKNLADVRIDPVANLSRDEAFERVLVETGTFADQVSELLDAGSLKIFPQLPPGEEPGHAFHGKAGSGYRHMLGWEITFRREGDATTYQAVVDAHSGQLVRLLDLNRYATVQGGVLPTTTGQTEITVGFPFATVTDAGGSHITDANGNYTFGGGTANVSLNGRYVNINDNCGAISLDGDGSGNVDFGSSAGTDCATPGIGGAGNTHAARSGFYHLTNINRKAAGYLPGTSWLNGTLTANMNINLTCNAFWNGSTVNFYRSGGGCGNTGEIAAVFLHEWGHGLDDNTGGSANENGSGEAVGDTFAFLETQDPCIGPGFFLGGSTCHNCDVCTGVRDVEEFSLSGNHTIASPATIEDDNGPNCDRFRCPYRVQGFEYQGPMGYEGHCESYIASSANWDLTQMLIAEHGSAGWDVMDSIWYGSMTPSKSAYQLVSGGKCNPSAVVDGCGSDNWYTVFLAVDDDNGNLADGTPNGCRIWDAFDAHGIACGSRPDCSVVTPGAPSASFTFDCTGTSCDFTDTSTDDGTIVAWDWDFGDGNGSTAQNPTHDYASSGVFLVTLTVTDNDSLTDDDSQNVNAGGDVTPPVVSNVQTTNDNGNMFTISFTTDEPATSTITFIGGASGTFNAETTLTTNHSVQFNGSKNVLYTFNINVTDAASNSATYGPFQHQND